MKLKKMVSNNWYYFRQFAENELWPIAGQIDKSCQYPEQQILKMGELGTTNLIIIKSQFTHFKIKAVLKL